MTTIRTLIAITAAGLLFSAGVHAQVYIAGGVGVSKVKTTTGNDDGIALSIGAGYRFNQYLTAEVSYTDFGSGSSSFDKSGTSGPGEAGSGFGFAMVGSLSLSSSWALLAKLGMQDLGSGQFDRASPPTDIGWTATIGAGAQWSIDKNFAMRAMFEEVDGDQNLDNIRVVSIGALYSF